MEDRGHSRLIVTCACGMRMWVTDAHMGMTGHCRRCGQSFPITPDNTEPAPESSDTPERRQRHARALLEQALGLIGRQKHDRALQILSAVLGLDDTNAEAWYWRGYALYKKCAYSDACAALARSSELGRPDVERLLARVQVFREWEASPEVLLNVPAYRQAKTRAEARQYRVRVYNTPPDVLLASGDYVAASEACYIQKLFPEVRVGIPGLVGVDSDMDRASRLLAARKFAATVPLLEAAVVGYRNAGDACAWDHVDALWNLGYALSRLGRVKEGLESLTEAATKLAEQGRMKCWARCLITVLTHRKHPSLLSNSTSELEPLVRVCEELGLRRELLWIHILMDRALLEAGRLREAQRVWALMKPLGLKAGGLAAEEFGRLRVKLTPEACLRAVVYRLTNTAVRGGVGARRALLAWDRREKSAAQCLEALRAVQLAETAGFADDDLCKLAGNLCCELAIDAYACNARVSGRAWWTAALGRDPSIAEHVYGLTRRSLDRARRQGLMRLLDDHVRLNPSPEANAALAGLLVVHAMEALEAGYESKAISSLRIAVKLGLRQDDLLRQIEALGLGNAQWSRLGPAASTAWTAALVSAVEKNVASEETPRAPELPTWMGSGI